MEVHIVEAIVKVLNSAGVKYLIVGGLAVVAHGYERFTDDVDLVIGLKRGNIVRGLRLVMDIGYHLRIPVTPEQFADPVLREERRREKRMTVLQLWSDAHQRTLVDVFVYQPFDIEKEFAHARRERVVSDVSAPIVCYHTLLKPKAAIGRSQDLTDIEKLCRLDPNRKKRQS